MAVGVARQYVGDVIGNIIDGKKGIDIFQPKSTAGEYIAAGVTSLIPGSGIGASFARNVVAEGIVCIETHMKEKKNNIKKSVINIVSGTMVDLAVEKVSDKIVTYIASKSPKNYSSYAQKAYTKSPGINKQKIYTKMRRATRWNQRIQNVVSFVTDVLGNVISW